MYKRKKNGACVILSKPQQQSCSSFSIRNSFDYSSSSHPMTLQWEQPGPEEEEELLQQQQQLQIAFPWMVQDHRGQ